MRILTVYVAKQVLLACLLVLFIILSLDALAAIIDEMGDIDDSYTMQQALKFVLLSLPSDIQSVLPFAILIGCLVGLGSLANQSELLVIRSAGVSNVKIILMAIIPVLLLAGAGFIIGETIAPKLQQYAKAERAVAKKRQLPNFSKMGFWHREQSIFMHVNAVGLEGELLGVNFYWFDDSFKLTSAQFAERADFVEGYWLLNEVIETSFTDNAVETEHYSTLKWQGSLSPKLIKILSLQPDDLPTRDLWPYFQYLKTENLSAATYELAFWKKVLQPLSILSLVVVAASFVFGSLRNVTMGFRIFVGVMVGIVFRTLQEILGPASMVYGFSPIWTVLIPVSLCLMLGGYMLIRKV